MLKEIIDQSVFFLTFLKYTKDFCANNYKTYFESILSRYHCGFRKGFSVFTTLLPVIEKWRESLDSDGNFGPLLSDLSKAFDCLPHDLLIAKLHAYELEMPSLKLLHSMILI